MAQINHIKDLYENEDLSLREISRKTGHSFKTVQKYAYQSDWSEDNLPNTEPQGYPVLGDFIPVIDEWLRMTVRFRESSVTPFGGFSAGCGMNTVLAAVIPA